VFLLYLIRILRLEAGSAERKNYMKKEDKEFYLLGEVVKNVLMEYELRMRYVLGEITEDERNAGLIRLLRENLEFE
jgi:hypothetical protein